MQTFDQSLLHLYKDGLISFRDALAVATQPEDLRIALQSDRLVRRLLSGGPLVPPGGRDPRGAASSLPSGPSSRRSSSK